MFKVKKSSGGAIIDAGTYKAKIKAVEKKSGDYGEYLCWTFLAKNKEQGTTELSYLTSLVFSPRSKLGLLVEAAGQDVEVDDDLNLDAVLKKVVKIKVEDDEKDDMCFSKIVEVLHK